MGTEGEGEEDKLRFFKYLLYNNHAYSNCMISKSCIILKLRIFTKLSNFFLSVKPFST